MDKIFFTGGTGFIGTHVVHKLIEDYRCEIYVLTRKANVDGISSEYIHFIHGDISDSLFLTECIEKIKPTVLFHFAWSVQESGYAVATSNMEWVIWSEKLAEIFLINGGRTIIAAGTCFEYQLVQKAPLSIHSACIPENLYGRCKLAVFKKFQKLCNDYAARLVWGRIFYPYGEGEGKRKLITSALLTIIQRKKFVCNAPNNYLDYIHVNDIADIFGRLYIETSISGAVNIGSGDGIYIGTILKLIEKNTSMHGYIVCKNTDKEEFWVVSDRDLLEKLHYCCKENLSDNINKMYLYLLERNKK